VMLIQSCDVDGLWYWVGDFGAFWETSIV
jgi:hypothetical protein